MTATISRTKTNLDSVLQDLIDSGFDPGLDRSWYEDIAACGLRSKNLQLAWAATSLLYDEKPCTLRGLFYRIVSSGLLPSTDKVHYQRVGRLMTTLREAEIIPFSWLVDNVRSTMKPSSWSGLADFADTVRDCYRLDYWERLPEYVHVIVEKDAIAGVLSPVTRKYDVALSPIRGYVSLSFAAEIAAEWKRIDKPITAYYLGDYDASGFDLERDIREKLQRYCSKSFRWVRLGVNAADFEAFELIALEPKTSDKRSAKFIREHGPRCAELDALPATELRQRVETAIVSHIPSGSWERLQQVEQLEQDAWSNLLAGVQAGVEETENSDEE